MRSPPTITDQAAKARLRAILDEAARIPALRRLKSRKRRRSGESLWEAGLELVGSARMRTLNRKHRGKDLPTDVLSFPAPPIFVQEMGYLGDLLICLPVLERQAREQGHPPRVELEVLLVHGVLHLLGMDHERSAKDARQMAQAEALLLQRLGSPGESGLITRHSSGKRRGYGSTRTS